MAAPRGTKTTLAFGLVSCEVALYKTTGEAEKPPKFEYAGPNGGALLVPELGTEAATATMQAVSDAQSASPRRSDPLADDPAAAFAQIAAVDEAPAEPTWVEEGTGEQVPKSERRRGLRDVDGHFADLTDGLAEIEERTQLEEMRVADFIRTEEVRRERVLGSYYLAPEGAGAAKVVRLLHEAMRVEKRVAVVKWTKRSKQALGVLVPHPASKSLMVIELAWAEDVREVPIKVTAPGEVDVTGTEIAVACELVQAMCSTRAESLDSQVDDSRSMLRELIERVEAGETFSLPERPEVEAGADVIDLMRRGVENRDALAAAAA
jgi:DNA end-binding protein Ku